MFYFGLNWWLVKYPSQWNVGRGAGKPSCDDPNKTTVQLEVKHSTAMRRGSFAVLETYSWTFSRFLLPLPRRRCESDVLLHCPTSEASGVPGNYSSKRHVYRYPEVCGRGECSHRTFRSMRLMLYTCLSRKVSCCIILFKLPRDLSLSLRLSLNLECTSLVLIGFLFLHVVMAWVVSLI